MKKCYILFLTSSSAFRDRRDAAAAHQGIYLLLSIDIHSARAFFASPTYAPANTTGPPNVDIAAHYADYRSAAREHLHSFTRPLPRAISRRLQHWHARAASLLERDMAKPISYAFYFILAARPGAHARGSGAGDFHDVSRGRRYDLFRSPCLPSRHTSARHAGRRQADNRSSGAIIIGRPRDGRYQAATVRRQARKPAFGAIQRAAAGASQPLVGYD